MAINSIETATKYSSELDKMIVQKAVTGFFADNAMGAKFIGAKTVKIPDIDFVGLTDYNRDSGFANSAITVSQTDYTLTKDRARKMQFDREDMDETGIANLSGQILGDYVRTEVVPEVDAYVLSKLFGIANTKSHTTTYDESTAISELLNTINKTHDAAGFDAELVAFVNPTMYSKLMTSTELNRQIVISDFKKGDLNVKVQSINGVSILPVTSDRMKSTYTFSSSTTPTVGGFTPASGAKDVYAIVVPKRACSLVKKTEVMRIFTPEQNIDADAYVFNYRLYYDAFIKKSKLNTIHAIVAGQ